MKLLVSVPDDGVVQETEAVFVLNKYLWVELAAITDRVTVHDGLTPNVCGIPSISIVETSEKIDTPNFVIQKSVNFRIGKKRFIKIVV